MTKVYESMPLKKIWIAMQRQGISLDNTNAMKTLYRGMTANIKMGYKLGSEISIRISIGKIGMRILILLLNKPLCSSLFLKNIE